MERTIGTFEIPKNLFLCLHREIHRNPEKSTKMLSIRLQILLNLPCNSIRSTFILLSQVEGCGFLCIRVYNEKIQMHRKIDRWFHIGTQNIYIHIHKPSRVGLYRIIIISHCMWPYINTWGNTKKSKETRLQIYLSLTYDLYWVWVYRMSHAHSFVLLRCDMVISDHILQCLKNLISPSLGYVAM